MSEQYIIIHQDDDPFCRVPKALLDDSRISWKAKGVISYLLGKRSDWKVRITDIVNRSTDGRDAVRSAIEELKEAGYAKSECVKSDNGQFDEWRLHISDKPIFTNVSPVTAFPDLDKPEVENPTLSKNRDILRNDCTFIVPTMGDLISYAQEIGFPESRCKEFHAYYEMNGWKVGRNKMKSWKKAMAYWKSKDESKPLSVWEIKQKCESLLEAIKAHPCNRAGIRFNPQASPELKAEYLAMNDKLAELKRKLIS